HSARRKFDDVICYTDNKEHIKELGFPFTKIIEFDYSNFDPRWWNFPKMFTYYLQKKPFLHIDFDVFLEEGFSKANNLKAPIITEKNRKFDTKPHFFRHTPEAYKKLSVKPHPGKLICSGLLGSNEPGKIFRELCENGLEAIRNYKKAP
ncbi:MAG: DUF6734 family protein, partial [Lutibacter sp.]